MSAKRGREGSRPARRAARDADRPEGTAAALGPRRAVVLQAVVTDYIRSAEPVGSGTVAVRYRLGVSPATIRNDMALLTEMGFLEQPHTSAGRVPTDLGYRFYVDTLPAAPRLSPGQRRAITDSLSELQGDVEEALRRTAQLLSRLTHYAAVALTPVVEGSRVVRAELVPLGSAALLLVVSDTGRVDKRALDFPAAGDDEAVSGVSDALVREIQDVSLGEAAERVEALAARAAGHEQSLLEAVGVAFRDLKRAAEHAFLGGVANIEEAFERRESVRRLFEALDEEAAVLRLLRGLPVEGDDVTVMIGREIPLQAMREASVVVAPYLAGGRPVGAIAVVGPTRMEYLTAISSVGAVARRLTEIVDALAG
ncbi:MAG TPA: heat-inducible transcriptional repressor HrcA [Actinomycetota bacterium]|jgi:heat-inducible transcriptional repressor|nr:heat-inducible transcriptional repressor HrcA [Actinomycetota bacterium]